MRGVLLCSNENGTLYMVNGTYDCIFIHKSAAKLQYFPHKTCIKCKKNCIGCIKKLHIVHKKPLSSLSASRHS